MFIKHGADDIIERLKIIENDFGHILDIGCRCGYLTSLLKASYPNAKIIAADMSPALLNSFEHNHKLLIDEENLELPEASVDLITYSLGFNWINNTGNFLLNIRKLLKPGGIFIGNFVGGESLKNLRNILIEAEIATGYSNSPHISPFIRFDHVPLLFMQGGFLEIIADYENIKLKFDTPLDLMREIQNIGETNSLIHSSNYAITKQMFSLLEANNKNDAFNDQITLISVIAGANKKSVRLKL